MKRSALFLATLLISAIAASVSAARQSPAMDKAAEMLNESKWPEAETLYREITVAEPNNAMAWENLGEALLQQNKYKDAEAAFQHAMATGERLLPNEVNIARVFAGENDHAKAIAELHKVAAASGSSMRPLVLSADEFTKWNNDPDFKKVLDEMAPCRKPEFRQFDFWLGDWDVHAPGGPSVGHNLVTLEQDGCLLIEHWTASTGGQTGTSFNYYDIRDNKWHQLYLDNSGNAGAFPAMAGNFVGGKMVLLTDEKQKPLFRWTWYELSPGKVRQMSERSTDGGKTWQKGWDSEYLKIEPKK